MRPEQIKRAHGPYKHGNKWRVIIVGADGRRMVRSVETRKAAEEAIADCHVRATGARSIGSAVSEYLAACADRGLTPASVLRIEYHLERILQLEKQGDQPLTWLTGRGDELYAAARTPAPGKKPPAADTHRNALANGKAFGTWCVRKRWLRADPFAEVEPTGKRRAGRAKPQLRVDESRALMAFLLGRCEQEVRPELVAVLVALLLGSRAHEVVERDVRDLDDGGRLLWIPDSKTPNGRRTLEVPEVLRPLLLELARGRSGRAPLFLATDAPTARRRRGPRRATRYWLYYHCDQLCSAAGVPSITPHGLRRTHASIARGAGATGELVAAQLGHGSVDVQERSYAAPGAAAAGETKQMMRVLQGGRR